MKPEARRLAILLSHPTQYYSPWFRWMRRHTALRFRVFYLWDFGITVRRDAQFGASFQWDTDLLSGYDWELVPNTSPDPGTHHFRGLRNPALIGRLRRWKPEALLAFGYNWSSMLRAIGWCRLHGVPLIFRGDSHFIGRAAPRGIRALALRLLYRQFAAFAYVGAANRRYFAALGVPDRKLYFAPHCVDASQFDPSVPAVAQAAAQLRSTWGADDGAQPLADPERGRGTGTLAAPERTLVVLFAGKLVPAKQPMPLLEAFLELAPPNALLVFVGEGEDKAALQARAAAQAGARVRFMPFANQSEMPARYLAADLMVLPSRGHYETWGLAVNEAMCLGTPCLVSDRVGCREDLITEGETGWSFRVEDPAGLKRALAAALGDLADPAGRARLKIHLAARMARYDYSAAAQGLLAAVASLP
jgi:glycosyltransferase involved in cell wall biosynthesis